ncbi:MAG: M14 metallopeptidase family protein [Flavobacteriaceae bacterium]
MRYFFLLLFIYASAFGQDYFTKRYQPFNKNISSPETFLEYKIGAQHTRHDQIVAYLQLLAKQSNQAKITYYGKSHEGRKLSLLIISSEQNLANLEEIQKIHLDFAQGRLDEQPDIPVIINLAYNVHGNEPSSSEAALLAAYTLTASENEQIQSFLEKAIIFIDPTINPDGRDRHTQWANTYKGSPLVADPMDAEHNEYWPGGRTNHYWFDLNRDWLLAINPESQGKLSWYHHWYPNVVTDFHEMGSQSTYFFEPMKPNGSLDPIMPKDNYVKLNDLFATYFSKGLDSIGSLYFTKEAFDGTYPGYGSSYPDLQGGLGLLFEQASSRGLKQKTAFGHITFPFTIRNQFVSSLATVQAAVENKTFLRDYQKAFFESAISRSGKSKIKAYTFEEPDRNRAKAFIDKLLQHKVEVFKTGKDQYAVSTQQAQYRMVQTVFETYEKYRDSVYYDASAWSVANFYNIKYEAQSKTFEGQKIESIENLFTLQPLKKSSYAYVVDAQDYNVPALIQDAQKHKISIATSFKPFRSSNNIAFSYGSLVIPVASQTKTEMELFQLLQQLQEKHGVQVHAIHSGLSLGGVDLGSRSVKPIQKPKALMLIGEGTRSYEAGEVWHLLDTRVGMPITKVAQRYFDRVNLDNYNTFVLVSGSYKWNEKQKKKLKDWVAKGNTLLSIGTANKALIEHKIVKEQLVKIPKDSLAKVQSKPYVDAPENIGREKLGGVFLKGILDSTHPLAFGYNHKEISLYKNNLVWLKPSKSSYGTPVSYAENPHIDGYISKKIRTQFLPKSAPVVVSPIGKGRVILFAENPNFRGTTYGTNRMFLNAMFLGNHISVPNSSGSETTEEAH